MRLIDADKLIKSCQDENGVYFSYEAAVAGNTVEKAPTVDAVPVVFCDKCKHWDRDWNSDVNEYYCPMIDLLTDADFFCKYGERKGSETT